MPGFGELLEVSEIIQCYMCHMKLKTGIAPDEDLRMSLREIHDEVQGMYFMDLVSDSGWGYRQNLAKIRHGRFSFLETDGSAQPST